MPGQQKDFDNDRALPIQARDGYIDEGRQRRPRRCVVMRFWDISRSSSHHIFGDFLRIRAPHRYHPSIDQPYITLGSAADPDILANRKLPPEYLLLPSEFVNLPGKPAEKRDHLVFTSRHAWSLDSFKYVDM